MTFKEYRLYLQIIHAIKHDAIGDPSIVYWEGLKSPKALRFKLNHLIVDYTKNDTLWIGTNSATDTERVLTSMPTRLGWLLKKKYPKLWAKIHWNEFDKYIEAAEGK